MAGNLVFKAWQRSKLFDLAEKQGARLGGIIPLILTDTNTGQQTMPGEGNAPFNLLAAADIDGLKPGAIKHMTPAPFIHDAETTKFVHLDFWEKDLPWRYTPEKANGDHLRPWLVLLVGTGAEIAIVGNIANVQPSVLIDHNLKTSYLWAHTQDDSGHTIARIMSPRKLVPQTEHVAVLVPAFNADGKHMWNADGSSNFDFLPAFHFWRFWTAEAGDFESLAAALHIPCAGDAGKARLRYRRLDIDIPMEVGGAITSLEWIRPPADATVRADLDILNDEIPNAIGLPQYGRPWVPEPDGIPGGWVDDLNTNPGFRGIAGLGLWMGIEAQEALMDAAVQQAGALREAGQRVGYMALGMWASGSLWNRRLPGDKNERLRILGSIMGRMIASDGGIVLNRVTTSSSPLSPAVFSSAAQRLLRDRSPHTRHIQGANGGINRSEALDEANQAEKLPDRTPAGLPHFDTIIQSMEQPLPEELFGLDLAWLEKVMDELFGIVREVCNEYRLQRDQLLQSGQEGEIPALRAEFVQNILIPKLGEQLQARLPERNMPCQGWQLIQSFDNKFPGGLLEYYGRVLEADNAGYRLYDDLWQALVHCMFVRQPCEENRDLINQLSVSFNHQDLPDIEGFCNDLLGEFAPQPRSDQHSLNLVQLSDSLHAALDPRRPNAPARLRLCSQMQGIDCTRLTRPEFPIGLDFPTWDLLNKYDKEWLLPGASKLEKDSITALKTNPEFIDAYMLGINTQFMSEMRWRDLAVERTSTPLRMFWGQVNYVTQQRQADIEPLNEWTKALDEPLGSRRHQTIQPDDPENNQTGSRLVIAFHTPLFRRYPATLVYMVKPKEKAPNESQADYVKRLDILLQSTPELDMPAHEANSEEWRKNRQFFGPIFVGHITPDLTFFAFDVTPSDLDKYWLILDEPPTELRFRNNESAPDLTHSASFAASTLDHPTRVAISGAELEEQADCHD